jgi:transcriptional regulator PpsR
MTQSLSSFDALWRPGVETSPWRVLVDAAVDLAMLVDPQGVIRELSTGRNSAAREQLLALKGKPLGEVVGVDSRTKVTALLRTTATTPSHPREINLVVGDRQELPFKVEAVRLEGDESVLVLGRDLSNVSALQQRMVSLQQSMDREFNRLRQADTRYRVLFHVSAEAVLVADANGLRVLEANPAAAALTGRSIQDLQRASVSELLTPASKAEFEALASALEAGGRRSETLVTLKDLDLEVNVAAALFRQGGSALLLIRLWTPRAQPTSDSRWARSKAVIESMPDAFVVASEDRRIQYANPAFCELVQQASEKQVIGESIDRWIGRAGVDVNIMLANLREHGTVRNFSTIIRSDLGPPMEALVSAVQSNEGKAPVLGFVIRQVSSRLLNPASAVPRSVEQLRDLVGRISLKEIVRESTDMIEKMCIEAALQVSSNNRASAAQLLGLSRQGLYSKLARHGLPDPDPA